MKGSCVMRKKFTFALVFLTVFSIAVAFPIGTVFAASSDEVFIISGDTTVVMIRMPAASGEQYVALGDPDTEFFSKGDEAMLNIDGEARSKYVLVRGSSVEGELFLTVDGKNYRMRSAVSASGSSYEALDDPKTTLWGKGGSITLTVAGVDYPGYDVWQPLGRIWLPD